MKVKNKHIFITGAILLSLLATSINPSWAKSSKKLPAKFDNLDLAPRRLRAASYDIDEKLALELIYHRPAIKILNLDELTNDKDDSISKWAQEEIDIFEPENISIDIPSENKKTSDWTVNDFDKLADKKPVPIKKETEEDEELSLGSTVLLAPVDIQEDQVNSQKSAVKKDLPDNNLPVAGSAPLFNTP